MITTFNSIPRPHQNCSYHNGIYSDPSTNIADTRTTAHWELSLCNESLQAYDQFMPLLTIPFNNASNKNDTQVHSCNCWTIGFAHCSQYWHFKVGFSQAIMIFIYCERRSSLFHSLFSFLQLEKCFTETETELRNSHYVRIRNFPLTNNQSVSWTKMYEPWLSFISECILRVGHHF